METVEISLSDFPLGIEPNEFLTDVDGISPGLVTGHVLDVPGGTLFMNLSRALTTGETAQVAAFVSSHSGEPNRPTLAPGSTLGEIIFVAAGRKPSEIPGSWSGVLAYWTGSDWLRVSDDGSVLI